VFIAGCSSSSSATTPPAASQSSSVLKLQNADDRSQLAMLLDIKKESEAIQMELGEDTVGNLFQMLVCA